MIYHFIAFDKKQSRDASDTKMSRKFTVFVNIDFGDIDLSLILQGDPARRTDTTWNRAIYAV